MGVQRMADLVRWQAQACGRLGSPLYAVLLDRLADDVLASGPAAAVLAGHEDDPGPAALALRLAGTVHRLALTGTAPRVAAHYPSTGGDGNSEAAWAAVRSLLAERPEEVRAGLATAPQTNEVGRAAPLLGALLHVAGPDPLPVRLWEIGASGGLNLRAERFTYRAGDGGGWGPPSSPVVLDPAWDTTPAGAAAALEVVERVGGDVSPLDPTTPEGALRLESYVWPDQLARLGRLRGAIELARRHPARLLQAGAAELLGSLELAEGHLTVVWHSVMWQYLDGEEQAAASARLQHLGEQASTSAPLAHIAFEPRRPAPGQSHEFLVVARSWPGGAERVLGAAAPHGIPVTWRA